MRAQLRLLSRRYCHLCEEMLEALKRLGTEHAFDIEVLDVDEHPELLARFDELVPVLLADSRELCHYHLDVDAVLDYLRRAGFSSDASRIESRPVTQEI